MDPIISVTEDAEIGNNADTTMDSCDTIDESLVSALTTQGNPFLQVSTAFEDDDGDTHSFAASNTLISNASDSSNYFLPQALTQTKHHRPSDSLDYSTSSSTNSALRNELSSSNTCSYLGSIAQSLGAQQAFPSSMFPGQKLISPTNEKDTIDATTSMKYPSYFYYNSTSTTKRSRDNRYPQMPLSYQNATLVHQRSNVYHRRHDVEDDDFKKGVKCFFSARVLVTLAVSLVLGANLVRVGHHSKHHSHNRHKHHGVRHSSGSSDEYIKVDLLGGGMGDSFLDGLLNEDETDWEDDKNETSIVDESPQTEEVANVDQIASPSTPPDNPIASPPNTTENEEATN